MTTRTADRTQLDSRPLPVQARLSAAWMTLVYLVLYIDYFHLYQPGEIDSIRNGIIFEFEISGMLMSIFFVIIGIPGLMVLLSATLPARANRITNIAVTIIYIPIMVVNVTGATPDYAVYYVLTIGVELAIMAYILVTAARWPRA